MQFDKTSDLPLTLWLQGTSDPLFRQQFLRILPEKRWVMSAWWGERQVVVKVFAKLRHAQRELHGIKALQTAELLTPTLLHHDWLRSHSYYALVFEKVEEAQNVEDVWRVADSRQRAEIFHQLVKITARLHQAGFKQCDPHLQNFLFSSGKIHTIDAAQISKTRNGQSLSERMGLRNLALLLSQAPPEFDDTCETWYRVYIRERNLVFTLAGLAELKRDLKYWRRRHLRVYGKKVFRTTSKLICQRSWQQVSICDRDYFKAEIRQLVADPEAAMQGPNVKVLKAGNTCTVVQTEVGGHSLVIKRYNIKNFWHGLNRAWRPSRAALSWRNMMCLSLWRLGVPQPVAMIEKRIGPIRRQAYFITEHVAGNDLLDFCFTQTRDEQGLTAIANKIKKLFAMLDSVWLSHGDLKANNILLKNGEPVLLDLDAMKPHRSFITWQRSKRRDEERFKKNWEGTPELEKIFCSPD